MEWFYDNYPYDVAVEVKIKGNKMLPHQEVALEKVRNGTFKYKLPDMGRRNPFDFIVLKTAVPFIVVCEDRICKAKNLKTGETFDFTV